MTFLFFMITIFIVISIISSASRRRQVDWQRQPPAPQVDAGQMASVKRAVDEDVTVLGEELQQLDLELAGRSLDEATRSDYERALDAYDAAKESADAVTHPEHIRHVTEILEDGRYAIACVRARVAGEPLPQRRAPCFFNPQHGPSVRDVTWGPAGGTIRQVPACALDAERVEAGADPDTRKVMVGSQRVPYYEAGPAFAPWTAGYFGAFGLMPMMFMGTMMGATFAGFGGLDGGYGEGYGDGYDAGQDYGGGDGGGFDGGGFDGGGFDGGDFGDIGGGFDF